MQFSHRKKPKANPAGVCCAITSDCREEEESLEQSAEVRKGLAFAALAWQPISQTLDSGI